MDCPGEAREDWRIIQDIAQALGRPHGFTFTEPREIFEELRVASKGGVADYLGDLREDHAAARRLLAVLQRGSPTGAALDDHPGTPRLFERGSYNPVAKGSGPFYFPDGRARFNVAEYRPPVDDASEEYPIYLTTGRSSASSCPARRPPHRTVGQAVRGAADRDASAAGGEARIADGDWTTAETRRGTITLGAGGDDDPSGHDLHSLSLGGPEEREPAHRGRRTRSARSRNTRCAGAACARRMRRRTTRRCSSRSNRRAGPAHGQAGLPALLHRSEPLHRMPGVLQACSECDTHRGESMIHLEYVNRSESVQTVPVVCMHCEQPTCAEVCPADAIKRTGDGVVQSARKPRCIACGNCVVACPFGVPELYEDRKIMMKCDMCYDRTSVGKKPMCATVCPSQALFFGTREQIEQLRPLSTPVNTFQFGQQTITTQVT